MKWLKRCGAALLAAALLLSGCGKTPQEQDSSAQPLQARGRFVEEEFQVTDGTHTAENGMLYQTPGGALVVLQTTGETPGRWDSADGGKTWQYTDIPWAAECEPLLHQANLAVEEDGSLLVATNDPALYRISPQGETTQLNIKELEGFAPPTEVGEGILHASVNGLIALADGGFYLELSGYYMTDSHTYLGAEEGGSAGIYSADGIRRKLLSVPSYGTMLPAGGELLSLDWDEKTVTPYSAAGEAKERRSLPASLETTAASADGQGNLYFFASRGVQRLGTGSNVLETVLDGETYSFGTPIMTILGQVVVDAEHFVLMVMDQAGESSFYRYTYDPQALVGESATLRVWALEDNDVLRLAVNTFRRQHPEVKVQLDFALAAGGVTVDDAVRTLNTELLAGKGPDVLILDGVPAESFAKNGLLADLTPYVDTTALYEPFCKPFETEQGVFYLPALFHLNVLAGKAEDLAAIGTLSDLVRAVADSPVMWDRTDTENYMKAVDEAQRPTAFFESLDALFDLLWSAGAPAVLTKDGVDEAALESFLDACKTISDQQSLAQGYEEQLSMGFGTNTLFYDIPNGLVCYMYDSARIGAAKVENLPVLDYPVQFHFADGTPLADEDTVLRLFPGQTEGAYTPVLLAGISAAGSQQELAGAFVNTMLGAGVQDQAMPMGLPTTRMGVAVQIEQENEKYADQLSELPEGMAHGKFMADVEGLIAQLKTPVLTPRTVTRAVREAVDGYCSGAMTLEEATAAIQSATNLYLAEQK